MATETERKYLVRSDAWRLHAQGTRYRQAYLLADERCAVRVRIVGDSRTGHARGFLAVKGPTLGVTREEFEYPIPAADAERLLACCRTPLIEKTRYRVASHGHTWEIDEFEGANSGLVLAEVELAEAEPPAELPAWVGEEVSDDPRYLNSCLATRPYSTWGAEERPD